MNGFILYAGRVPGCCCKSPVQVSVYFVIVHSSLLFLSSFLFFFFFPFSFGIPFLHVYRPPKAIAMDPLRPSPRGAALSVKAH